MNAFRVSVRSGIRSSSGGKLRPVLLTEDDRRVYRNTCGVLQKNYFTCKNKFGSFNVFSALNLKKFSFVEKQRGLYKLI